jgi:hypothetical protein
MSLMYRLLSKLKIKPLTKSVGHLFRRYGPKQPENDYFMLFFATRAPPNGNKKVLKGPQLGGMYGLMSNLKNNPLTKSLGPLF